MESQYPSAPPVAAPSYAGMSAAARALPADVAIPSVRAATAAASGTAPPVVGTPSTAGTAPSAAAPLPARAAPAAPATARPAVASGAAPAPPQTAPKAHAAPMVTSAAGPAALSRDEERDDAREMDRPKRHRRMSVREAFRTSSFWFKMMSLVGFFILISGIALLAQGNLINAQAVDKANDPDDRRDMEYQAYSTMSWGWFAVALGLTWMGMVLFMEYLLNNVELRLPGKSRA